MNPAFDPFAGDEVPGVPETVTAPLAPAAPAAVDPFAAANAAPAPSTAPPQPATPKIERYTVVHHPAHGYGLVLATGELPGLTANRNAVIVGWFVSTSDPLTTDTLEPVTSS